MVGSYNWVQPALEYGGRSGNFDYFAVGQYVGNNIGIENPTPTTAPLHDATAQWYALTKLTALVDDNTRLSFIGGGASGSGGGPRRRRRPGRCRRRTGRCGKSRARP